MKLSNKVLGFLILIGFFLAAYLFYLFFFKVNLTSLEIISNTGAYKATLKNIKFEKVVDCQNKNCFVDKIPPFKYDLLIEKENYKNYKKEVNLVLENKIEIFLEKEISLEKIENTPISREELIKNIKNKKELKIDNDKVKYFKIYNSSYSYFITEGKGYFYDSETKKIITSFDFVPEINYIKKVSDDIYLIVSEVGTFIFNLKLKKIEYFSLFSDFIITENNYIGLVNSFDNSRKKNFGFEDKSGDLLIYYNTKTKKYYILESFSENIDKLYLENNKLYLEDNLDYPDFFLK